MELERRCRCQWRRDGQSIRASTLRQSVHFVSVVWDGSFIHFRFVVTFGSVGWVALGFGLVGFGLVGLGFSSVAGCAMKLDQGEKENLKFESAVILNFDRNSES